MRYCLAAIGILLVATSSHAGTSIAPPAGSLLVGRYVATGSQIYTCTAKGDGLAWGAAEPDADLAGADGQVVIRHFKGPTWEARDGSKVVGAVAAKQPSPAADAVPWLLLTATTTGAGMLAGTKYVVRQDTVGGMEPSGGCPSAGLKSRVPYTATYLFYK